VLLCLACAVLERADPQITLHVLGERLLELAAEPALSALGFSFTLHSAAERRDLVAVCRTLLELGVLQRVAGDEEGFVFAGRIAGRTHDALYDVQRPLLAGMLAAVRGPSTWPADDAPVGTGGAPAGAGERATCQTPTKAGARRCAMHLARRLLDDPVLYLDRARRRAARLFHEPARHHGRAAVRRHGLVAEQRAEGLALADETGELSDVAMPAEGTEAHVTLLVAEFLASQARRTVAGAGDERGSPHASPMCAQRQIASARYWRKSAREAGLGAGVGANGARAAAHARPDPARRAGHTHAARHCPFRTRSGRGPAGAGGARGARKRIAFLTMTDDIFDAIPGAAAPDRRPDLPEPHRQRWQPLRLGLVELFLYDSEEFWFRDGHLLLRGNNGTGKSKVLSLTLPLLLDAQLRPSRVEPDGDSGKKMAWNLLMGSYPRRIGYAWIEFGRIAEDGKPRYLTLGAGMSAVATRAQVDSWFFVLEPSEGDAGGPRIGRDVWLTSTQRVVLTRERLRELVEGRGQVFESATAYRRAVDERLFHLGTRRYDALMDTLIQLRQPQLSKKPDEAGLSNALTEALPPLPQELLTDVAQALNQLEEDRRELQDYEALAKAVGQFNQRYQRYAAINARRQARGLRSAQSGYDSASRSLNEARAAWQAAQHAEVQAKSRLDAADAALLAGRTRLDQLQSDPAMKDANRLNQAERDAAARAADLDDATRMNAEAATRLEREHQALEERDTRRKQAEDALATAREDVAGAAFAGGIGEPWRTNPLAALPAAELATLDDLPLDTGRKCAAPGHARSARTARPGAAPRQRRGAGRGHARSQARIPRRTPRRNRRRGDPAQRGRRRRRDARQPRRRGLAAALREPAGVAGG
jgi:uncharacterized protein (TIGR02678 family)